MQLKKLEQIFDYAKEKKKKRLVVAYGQDPNTLGAVSKAVDLGFIDITLVGDENVIKKVCEEKGIDPNKFRIIDVKDEKQSGVKAVDLINSGEGDVLMKGLISTDKYMRCILDKERGLMKPKSILTHIGVIDNPNYPKLLLASDMAIIPTPDLKQKAAITNYLIKVAKSIGIEEPKVAIVTATEKANPKMPACIDASVISKMGDRGQIKGAKIDGPLAMDVAIDPESVRIKKIKSDVAGEADCLVFPNIETGNVFYKSMTKLAKSDMAAIVVGAKVPAILPSRGDSEKSKLYSIALAALME